MAEILIALRRVGAGSVAEDQDLKGVRGIAITAVGILDFLIILFYTGWRYGYHISKHVLLYASIQLPFGILAYLVTFVRQPWAYWTAGILIGLVSTAVSLHILRQKTNLWESLTAKVKRRLGRG